MTISAFANQHSQMDDWLRSPVRRAYREQKRDEAHERQARFDAEVRQAARDHNCSEVDARDIVNGRRRAARRKSVAA